MNANIRFVDAREIIIAMITSIKTMRNFNLPENFRAEAKEAADLFADGKEGFAIKKMAFIERGLENLTIAFVKKSKDYFARAIQEFKDQGADKDIIQRVEKHYEKIHLPFCSSQAELTFEQCVKAYNDMWAVVSAAVADQQIRTQKRYQVEQARLAEEAQKKEACQQQQRETERLRRKEEAAKLLAAFV